MCKGLVVARELAPAGVRSTPKPITEVHLMYLDRPVWGCFAAQREQAPSPHKPLPQGDRVVIETCLFLQKRRTPTGVQVLTA